MAFPSTISTFPIVNPTDRLNSPSHSALHNSISSVLTQVQTVIGVEGASSVVGSLEYLIKSPDSNGGGHVQTANKGGTGQTSYIKGNILVAQSTSVLSKLAVGADGSALIADSTQATGIKWGTTSSFFPQQIIGTQQGSTALGLLVSGSSNDGSVWYKYDSNNTDLSRYARDTQTGLYKRTHTINPTISIPAGDFGTIIVLGIYIYFFSDDGTNVIVSRFLAADLTGEQAMTVPTVSSTYNQTAWTDGTFAYLVAGNTPTTSRKWSVSGTTFSAVTTATFFSDITTPAIPATTFYDGTNAYLVYVTTDWNTSVTIAKLTDIMGVAATTTTILTSYYSPSSDTGVIGINMGAGNMYFGRWFPIFNQTAQITAHVMLDPITKP